MNDAFADWYAGTVDVDTVGEPDEWGAIPTTPHADVACQIEDKVQLVRDATGEETVSTATLWLPLDKRAWFTPGSVVHVQGRESRVIMVAVTEIGDPDLDGIGVTLA